ncbi:DUF1427 family protein [Caulobacter segnis]
MKPYLLSLCAGLLVGVIYALLGVRSPAPPAIALIGLMGILLGEQSVPIVKRLMAGAPVVSYLKTAECAGQVLGPQAIDPQKIEGQA